MTTEVLLKNAPAPGEAVRPVDLASSWVLSATLALLCFATHVGVMHVFAGVGVFDFNDILFEADTRDFHGSIANGMRSIRKLHPDLLNSVHPYVWFYFSPAIRLVAKSLSWSGLASVGEEEIRLAIGLYVIPAVAAGQTAAFVLLLQLMRFGTPALVVLALLNIVAFANLLYGSIPDHYAITNLGITLALLLAVGTARFPKLDRPALWVPLGLFATGITITNVVFVGLAHFFTQVFARKLDFRRAAARTALFSGLLVVFVLATGEMLGLIMDGRPAQGAVAESFVTRYLRLDMGAAIILDRAAAGLSNAIVPTVSDITANYEPKPNKPASEISKLPRFTLEPARGSLSKIHPLGIIALIGMVWGGAMMIRKGGDYGLAATISASVVTFNVILHGIWGSEYFLYSEHWITPSLVLLSGIFLAAPGMRRALMLGAAFVVLGVAVNSLAVLWHLNATLRAAAGFPG